MFRITEDPSPGSLVQCLAENYENDSVVSFDMNVVGVIAAYCDQFCVCVCVCSSLYRKISDTVNYTTDHYDTDR